MAERQEEFINYRSGVTKGKGVWFEQWLPNEPAVAQLLHGYANKEEGTEKQYSSSLCWGEVGVYSPVNVPEEYQSKSIEKSKGSFRKRPPQTTKSRKTGHYHILTSAEELNVSHTHNWEGGGMVEGIVSKGLSVYSLIQSMQAGQSITTRGSMIHKKPIYQDSELIEITIPVALFTYDDPVNDIIKPITQLTALTYPFQLESNGWIDFEELREWIEAQKQKIQTNNDSDSLKNDAVSMLLSATQAGSDALEEVSDQLTSMFSVYQYITPHYFTLEFSNGILELPACAITNLDVTYHSPWTCRKPSKTGFRNSRTSFLGDILDRIEYAGATIGNALNSDTHFRTTFSYPGDRELATKQLRRNYEKLKKAAKETPVFDQSGYPSYAELEITFKAIEPHFSQDFLKPGKKVTVTETTDYEIT